MFSILRNICVQINASLTGSGSIFEDTTSDGTKLDDVASFRRDEVAVNRGHFLFSHVD